MPRHVPRWQLWDLNHVDLLPEPVLFPSSLPLPTSLYSPQHNGIRTASTSQKNHSLCFWNLQNSSGERYSFNRSESAPLCLTFHAILLSVQFLFPLFHTPQPTHPLQTSFSMKTGSEELINWPGWGGSMSSTGGSMQKRTGLFQWSLWEQELLKSSVLLSAPSSHFPSSCLAVFPSLNIIVSNNLGCVTNPKHPRLAS